MKNKFIIGIDLGGTNLKICLLDSRLHFKARRLLSTCDFSHPVILINAIAEAILKIIADNSLKTNDILGVGMGLPGPIDVEKGLVHFFPNIPGWIDVPLKNILRKKTGLPVFIDNDANLMCLAEFKLGSAKTARNAVCLTLGTGVGGGLIVDGKLYRGSSFAAGEIGHMPINEKGPACNCGGIACLESYIGNRRIASRVKKVFKKDIPLEVLSRMAKNNDKRAIRIWEDVGARLGLALVAIVNLLNPDRIVIGGGVANAGRVLFAKVEETIFTRAMVVQAKKVKVFKAKLGNDAGMLGAALLVKDQIGGL
jgi:glucokinase